MSEIEKMRRYIERTKIDERLATLYGITLTQAYELAKQALGCGELPIESIFLAFDYGKAKGYRAAQAKLKEAI